jgi:putative transposase
VYGSNNQRDTSIEDQLHIAEVAGSCPEPSLHRDADPPPRQRLIGEIKRRTAVVGIFPNEDAITRLVGAILLGQNDEWAVHRARYMSLKISRH